MHFRLFGIVDEILFGADIKNRAYRAKCDKLRKMYAKPLSVAMKNRSKISDLGDQNVKLQPYTNDQVAWGIELVEMIDAFGRFATSIPVK